MSAQEFVRRLSEKSEHRVVVETAFRTVDVFRQKTAEIRNDRLLTPQGHNAKIAEAVKSPREFLAELRKQVADDRSELAERRDHFQLRPPSSDRHAELAEVRMFLRGLARGEAAKLALTRPAVAEAILGGAFPELSGLDDHLFERVHAAELDRQHGKELRTLKVESDELDVVDSAIAIAESQLLSEAGLNITTKQAGGTQ
jgi:hypothetical protein